MKKIVMILGAILCALNAGVGGGANVFSNIPPAKIELINLNPQSCSKSCLKDLAKDKKIFSFMARFDSKIDDEDLQAVMVDFSKKLGVYYKVRFELLEDKLEVALIIPRKTIGKYSTTTIDTILSYLAFRDIDFRFKVFDSVDENPANLTKAIDSLSAEKFNFVIAVLSKEGSLNILQNLNLPTYIPTLKKPTNWEGKDNIIFGGIDYDAQIALLLKEVNRNTLISYNDDSALGAMIGKTLEAQVAQKGKFNFIQEVVTNKDAANFSTNLSKRRSSIANGNIFLNTRIIISGLLLSQIGLLKNMPNKIFSTQVNYNPAILLLLRGINTKNLIIANSIGRADSRLIEYGGLLSADIKYDWVNYSTALGADLFLSKMKDDIRRYFSEDIDDSQVAYKTQLYGINNGAFVRY